MATLRFPGAYNGYLPEATGQVINYVREENRFPLTRYVQMVPVRKMFGVYNVIERDEAVRLIRSGLENDWADGDYRPTPPNGLRYSDETYRTKRKNFGYRIGYLALQQTEWDIQPAHTMAAVSQAMTELTNRVHTALQTSGNWSGNTFSANALNGGAGRWSQASANETSPYYMAIFKTLVACAAKISLLTNGHVMASDLRVVLGADAAVTIAATSEMNEYCRESPAARDLFLNGQDPQFMRYGLPQRYRGFEFVVEDSPVVTSNPVEDGTQATESTGRSRVALNTEAYVLSRVGGIDGVAGAPSFSTVQMYHYNGEGRDDSTTQEGARGGGLLQVEAFDRPRHKLVEGYVVTNVDAIIPAPQSGMRITEIL